MGNEVILNDSNFQKEVIESDIPVLVDFWAEWCAPCRLVAPIVEEIAEDYKGKVKVCKLDTEESPTLAGQYGIISIPTLLIFKDGKPVDQIVGAVPKGTITKKLDAVLS